MVFKDKFLNNNCSNWGIFKLGVLQGSVMVLLLFLVYINNLPNVEVHTNLSDNPKTTLYMDDASVIVNNPIFTDFEKVINMVFQNKNGFLLICFLYVWVKLISCNL